MATSSQDNKEMLDMGNSDNANSNDDTDDNVSEEGRRLHALCQKVGAANTPDSFMIRNSLILNPSGRNTKYNSSPKGNLNAHLAAYHLTVYRTTVLTHGGYTVSPVLFSPFHSSFSSPQQAEYGKIEVIERGLRRVGKGVPLH